MNHQANVINVNTTRRDVGGYQDGGLPTLKGIQCLGTRPLSLPTMQCSRRNTFGLKLLSQPIGAALGSHKHNCASLARTDFRQHFVSHFLFHKKDMMIHLAMCNSSRFDRVLNRVAEVFFDESIYILVQSRTKQKSLPTLAGCVENLFNCRHKAHIAHEIGFI